MKFRFFLGGRTASIVRLSVLAVSVLVGLQTVKAQKTIIDIEPETRLQQAKTHINNKNYSDAYNLFSIMCEQYQATAPTKVTSGVANADMEYVFFQRALCAYYLMHNDVDVQFEQFKTLFANSNKLSRADFYIANWHVQKGDFASAIKTYRQMDTNALTRSEMCEYNYKIAYCYFLQNDMDRAKISFMKVKDTDSRYAAPAKYYYAHILYTEGNYKMALEDFQALKKDRNFAKVVPYYIAQIYYFEHDYEQLIALAPQLSKSSTSSKRETELNRMLGDAYYKLNRYEEAIPYIDKSIKSNQGINREDNYLMGYCLMETSQETEAMKYLLACTQEQDAMAQNALYCLGYCYLLQSDSLAAMNSYKAASDMEFDKKIQEDALLSYAKLSVNYGSMDNEQLKRKLSAYIQANTPKDKKQTEPARLNEARTCLASVYERSKNYGELIDLVEKMKNRSTEMNKLYVKSCLNYGIELLNQENYEQCIAVLNKIDNNLSASNNEITASSRYVKAEAYYRTNKFKQSTQTLNAYYSVPDCDKNTYHTQADYLMGYTLFKQKQYSQAKNYFTKVSQSQIAANIISDANIRLADCSYMLRDYAGAIEAYDRFIQSETFNADYATYQKAMAYGASGNQNKKASTLADAVKKYPNSAYISSMYYELANTYLALDNNAKALETYQKVVNSYPNNPNYVDCLGRIGMIQYQQGKLNDALATLDKVVRQYPNTQQAKAALSVIKNIYMDKNDADGYLAYANKVGNVKVSKQEQEDLLYNIAENNYSEEKYQEAEAGFKSYLAKFSDGKYSEKAEYYLGDCLLQLKDSTQAAEYFYKVASRPTGTYTERALVHAGRVYEGKNDPRAIEVYTKLEKIASNLANRNKAQVGLMNTYFDMDDYNNAITSAQKILSSENLDANTRDKAYYIIASSYLQMDKTQQAEEYFSLLTPQTSKYSSEAQYTLALIKYTQNNHTESEKIIRQMSKNGAEDYYLAKAFILWADIFAARGNEFQAIQTLKSIIDNFDEDDSIVNQAQEKLNKIQNKQSQDKEENEQILKSSQESVDEVIIEDNK